MGPAKDRPEDANPTNYFDHISSPHLRPSLLPNQNWFICTKSGRKQQSSLLRESSKTTLLTRLNNCYRTPVFYLVNLIIHQQHSVDEMISIILCDVMVHIYQSFLLK